MQLERLGVACLILFMSAAIGCDDPPTGDGLFWASGVQEDLDPDDLDGWTECFREPYDIDGATAISEILEGCDGENLMLACRPVGKDLLSLAAMADREDVLMECEEDKFDCSHTANGVGWYYLSVASWGFAPAGLLTNLDSCDTDGSEPRPEVPRGVAEPAGGGGGIVLEDPELRLCWNLGSVGVDDVEVEVLNGGYRCGYNGLNGSSDWERLIYTSN
jgi:hypothetical protein